MKQLADGLRALSVVPGAGACAAALARVLPLLAHGNYQAQVGLLDHFQEAMDMWGLDEAAAAQGGLPPSVLQALGAAASGANNSNNPGASSGAAGNSTGAAAGGAVVAVASGGASVSAAEDQVAQLVSFINLLQSLTRRTPALPSSAGAQAPLQPSGSMGGSTVAAAAAAAAAAVAPGNSFRESLLRRSVPATLASYLLAVFACRQDSDGERSNTAGLSLEPSPACRAQAPPSHSPAAAAGITLAPPGVSPLFVVPPPHHSGTPPRSLVGTPTATPASNHNTPAVAAGVAEQLAGWCVPVGSAEWRAALGRPGVIASLHLLVALSAGHASTVEQACSVQAPGVDRSDPDRSDPGRSDSPGAAQASTEKEGGGSSGSTGSEAARGSTGAGAAAVTPLLLLLHLLEGTAGGAQVAPLAESCLDTFAATCAISAAAGAAGSSGNSGAAGSSGSSGSSVAVAIAALREARRAREREIAARRRTAMLTAMGVSPVHLPASPTASSVSPGMPSGSRPHHPWGASVSPGATGPNTPGGGVATPPTATTPAGTTVPEAGSQAHPSTPGGSAGQNVAEHGQGSAGADRHTAAGGLVSPGRAGGGGTGAAPTPTRSALALALASPAGSQLAAELAALEAEEGDEGEEDAALTCCVCREGYAVRPNELLCAYVYCKALPARPSDPAYDDEDEEEDEEFGEGGDEGFRVVGDERSRGHSFSHSHAAAVSAASQPGGFLSAASWPLPVGGTPAMLLPGAGTGPIVNAYSTVTYFNLIHASCHAAARSADANLRAPKREWDGATLRNGEVRCGQHSH